MAGKVKSKPPMPLNLSFETAASLEHVLNGFHVRAQREATEGHPSLLEHSRRLEPLWMAITRYLEEGT
jgi:hypothetical protein